jgi:formate hydrogenlyase subunit 3/multisubunit Na+/H+ antiporter MnhD subunit
MKLRRKWVSTLFTIGSALLILLPALLGFSRKFYAFLMEAWGSEDGAFAVAPVINYLLASLGFLLMLGWAIFHGMFRDIEQPKRTMLEIEGELDAAAATPVAPTQGELTHA